MTRFDRHIIKRIAAAFFFFIAALILFFIVLHYVEHSDDFVDGGAPLMEIFLVYYPNYIPEIVRLISPLAIFLASIYVTGKLAQELQIIALQASGVSLYRLAMPYLVMGLVLSGFMFWFNGWVVPNTNATVLEFEQEYIQSSSQTRVSDIHRQNRPGELISVGYYDAQDSVAYRVSIQQFVDGGNLVSRTDAPRMRWNDSLRVWRMEDAVQRNFRNGQLLVDFREQDIDTTLQVFPQDFARSERDVEAMTIDDASAHIEQLRRSGAGNLGRPLMAYYDKFAYPVANLILIMMSLPLAVRRLRGGQAVRFGIALATAFAYLALQKLFEPFGYSGAVSPIFTTWLPHVVFAVVTIVLYWHARK